MTKLTLVVGVLGCNEAEPAPADALEAGSARVGEQVRSLAVGASTFRSWQAGALSTDGAALYMVDAHDPRVVRIPTRSGEQVAAFGERGSGPGEMRMPAAVMTAAPGEYVVLDTGLRRASRFQADGGFIGSVDLPYPAPRGCADPDRVIIPGVGEELALSITGNGNVGTLAPVPAAWRADAGAGRAMPMAQLIACSRDYILVLDNVGGRAAAIRMGGTDVLEVDIPERPLEEVRQDNSEFRRSLRKENAFVPLFRSLHPMEDNRFLLVAGNTALLGIILDLDRPDCSGVLRDGGTVREQGNLVDLFVSGDTAFVIRATSVDVHALSAAPGEC